MGWAGRRRESESDVDLLLPELERGTLHACEEHLLVGLQHLLGEELCEAPLVLSSRSPAGAGSGSDMVSLIGSYVAEASRGSLLDILPV